MTTENAEVLLKITDEQINFYQNFMAGQGNCDEFEFQLYSHYTEGAHEDYLTFGYTLLKILHWRKFRLEKFLKGDDWIE